MLDQVGQALTQNDWVSFATSSRSSVSLRVGKIVRVEETQSWRGKEKLTIRYVVGNSTRSVVRYSGSQLFKMPETAIPEKLKQGVTGNKARARNLKIAQAVHEIIRAYDAVNFSTNDRTPSWPYLPAAQQEAAIACVAAVVAGSASSAEVFHNNWVAKRKAEGWAYGYTFNAEGKQDPTLLPFQSLPPIQRTTATLMFAATKQLHQAFPKAK